MKSHSFSRRNFLKIAGLSGIALVSNGFAPFIAKSLAQSESTPDLEVRLRAVSAQSPILAGNLTNVWSYQGEVLQGDPSALEAIPNSYLGPIFRVKTGQHIRIHFVNELPEASIIHWHGLILPEAMDAHPHYAIASGETYVYDFQVINRAGSYWYHPHPHGSTATQVYNGLAGLFIVTDDEEIALGLPTGAYDIPLAIQDRSFDADNQFRYITGGAMTAMMTEMMGFLGDQILVNGQANYELNLESRAYRIRLLNGSNFRILKLGWLDGTALTVIGTDGGLLEAPVQRPYVTLSPGERIDLWVDLATQAVGSQLELRSLPFTGVEMGGTMMGGMEMPETTSLPHGQEFTVLKVNITEAASSTSALPERLTTIDRLQIGDAINSSNPRIFEIAMLNEVWTINGRSYEMDAVAEDEIVQANSLEVWEFVNLVNPAPMGGMEGHGGHDMGNMGGDGEVLTEDQMAHPMHIHGVQFQILERSIDEAFRAGWESLSAGYVDDAWKDTVLLMPGERVKLLMRFGSDLGLYVFHCHNLEHEDLGLMRNYRLQ
jgi:blue copper oxidase